MPAYYSVALPLVEARWLVATTETGGSATCVVGLRERRVTAEGEPQPRLVDVDVDPPAGRHT
jgi:hypothetical protein